MSSEAGQRAGPTARPLGPSLPRGRLSEALGGATGDVMLLAKFTMEMEAEIGKFRNYWTMKRDEARDRGEDPSLQWPLDMSPGEWDDQFEVWREMKATQASRCE